MDATPGLRHRDALHAVGPGLVLQLRVGTAAADLQHDLLEPAEVGRRGRQDLRLPAHALRVPAVHLEQVGRPQRGLVAPRPRPDLHDHVLLVVGVRGNQQLLHPAPQLGGPELGLGGLLARVGGHLGVSIVPGHGSGLLRLAGRLLVLTVGQHDLAQLGELLAQPAEAVRVGRHLRGG